MIVIREWHSYLTHVDTDDEEMVTGTFSELRALFGDNQKEFHEKIKGAIAAQYYVRWSVPTGCNHHLSEIFL